MLEVNQLSRKYDDFVAVENVSFTIDKGEIVGLLGHNGAGKTTIMKMISGYLEPNTGSITVDHTNLHSEPKTVQQILGYLPENLPVYGDMVVADYLDFAADLKGLKHDAKVCELKRVIQIMDVKTKLLAPISTLSRGYKQRVGVAQAMLGHPKLLILDEPTNGLDPQQTQHMRDLIREVAQHATVILSTHIMQEVEALCTRVLMLHLGRLALDAQLAQLRRSNHVLLETSLAEKDTNILTDLALVDSLEVIEKSNNLTTYRITLQKQANPKKLSANIANAILAKSESLCLLKPELHDLETLFREISQGSIKPEELNNAA
jgi:ABC-2 type transport system ATP-binding protein